MSDLLEEAETLQNLLLSKATGGPASDPDYRQLRQVFVSTPQLESLLPRFVRTSRDLHQFWEFIKAKFPTDAERRSYIWDEFAPLIAALEKGTLSPSDETVWTSL